MGEKAIYMVFWNWSLVVLMAELAKAVNGRSTLRACLPLSGPGGGQGAGTLMYSKKAFPFSRDADDDGLHD